MLVLSRKTGQRAVIAGNIHVIVLAVRGNQVKLGFEGPSDVPIHREEVLHRIAQETPASESDGRHEHAGRQVRKEPGGSVDTGVSRHPIAGAVFEVQ